LVLIAGQVGARQNFWFNLTDDLLDLRAETLTVPAELAKNRKEQRIYLTEVETQLLREQLLVRATGTQLVFPTVTGKRWTRGWLPRAGAHFSCVVTGTFTRARNGCTRHVWVPRCGRRWTRSGQATAAKASTGSTTPIPRVDLTGQLSNLSVPLRELLVFA
jgi:hypothetical protein